MNLSIESVHICEVKKTRQQAHKNIVGDRVRDFRIRITPSVSQEDLSGRLAKQGVTITQTSISKIENRTRYVLDYEAEALAMALKVSVAALYGEK